jgi:hypothetical protein
MTKEQESVKVTFHIGKAKTTIDASHTAVIAALKQTAMQNLQIAPDPNVDYVIEYQGKDVQNEGQTLSQLVGEHLPHSIEFHLRKVPKGGT